MGQNQGKKALAGALILAALALAGCKEQLKPFTTKDGRFNAMMPCGPSVSDMQLGGGRIAKFYTCKVKGGEYGVLVARLPAIGPNQQAQLQANLDEMQASIGKSFNGKVLKASKAYLAGVFGREIRYSVNRSDYPAYDTMRLRVFILGSLMYAPMAVGSQKAADAEMADQFLDSLDPIPEK
jgi:hypothetical protein